MPQRRGRIVISYTAKLEFSAVLRRFVPAAAKKLWLKRSWSRHRTLQKLREQWASRVSDLAAAGWLAFSPAGYLEQIRRCYPCSLPVNRAWKCHQRFCPFCYARNLALAYDAMEPSIVRHKGGKLIAMHRVVEVENTGELPPEDFAEYILEQEKFVRTQLRHLFPLNRKRKPVYGGMYQMVIAPKSETVWLVRHSLLLFVAGNYPRPKMVGWRVRMRKLSRANVVKSMGRIFSYPRSWMLWPAKDVAGIFTAMAGTRLTSTFGDFRKEYTDAIRGTVSTGQSET